MCPVAALDPQGLWGTREGERIRSLSIWQAASGPVPTLPSLSRRCLKSSRKAMEEEGKGTARTEAKQARVWHPIKQFEAAFGFFIHCHSGRQIASPSSRWGFGEGMAGDVGCGGPCLTSLHSGPQVLHGAGRPEDTPPPLLLPSQALFANLTPPTWTGWPCEVIFFLLQFPY